MQEIKTSIRQELKQRRQQLEPDQRKHQDQHICEQLLLLETIHNAQGIFCYLSTELEVNTRPIVTALKASGKTVVVPKIMQDEMVAVEFTHWQDVEPAELGILTPLSDSKFTGSVDICITPGLGFSSKGARIGYGRGYYDRWLAQHAGLLKIGLCYVEQLDEDIPMEDSDIYMDIIITGAGVTRTGS